MTTLHDVLQCLQPTSWEAVPQSSGELREYLRDIFRQSRLIAESLPDPPPYDNNVPNCGESSAIRLVPSSARVGETDPEIISLQKQWGKPIKMGGPRDNPLGVHVWKLSANDGGGQWFGRRSVHEGMSFARWRKKLSSEYDETLKLNREKIEKGQTPDRSIRGIGAEQKVETVEVKDEDGSVLGQVTVYHVSAQFPKPTAPRDFVAMIITSECGLRVGGTKQPGRSWIMISKPCEHPGVPHKDGYIRGEYESVEMIREIPNRSRGSGSTSSGSSDRTRKEKDTGNGPVETKDTRPDALGEDNRVLDDEDDEMNPVEWIMVTRSDPGGNIPRWMVDKGTPKSVGADAAKFVDWAVQDDQPKTQVESLRDAAVEAAPSIEVKSDSGQNEDEQSDSEYYSDTDQSHHGLIASVTGLLNTGLERFAPQAFLEYIPHQHETRHSHSGDLASQDAIGRIARSTSNDITQTQSSDYFSTREPDHTSLSSARSELVTPTVEDVAHTNLPPSELMAMTKTGKLNSHEKELVKLALRKREIDSRLETLRSERDKLQLPSQSAPSTPLKGFGEGESEKNSGIGKRPTDKRSSTPASSGTKQSQRGGNSSDGQSSSNPRAQAQTPEPQPQQQPADARKAASHLSREEAKLLKHLRKIETSQLKVATKIEARRRKEAERSERSKSKSEVEGLRSEVKDLKKELGKLRAERQKWVDLVGSLQAENAKLAARQGQS